MKKVELIISLISVLIALSVGWMFANRQPIPIVIDADIPTQDNMRGAFRYVSERPVQFSPDGRYVAALVYRGSNKNTIGRFVLVPDQLYFWDVQERKRLRVIRLNNDAENAHSPATYQIRSDGKLCTIRDSLDQSESVSLFLYDPSSDSEQEIQTYSAKASFLFSSDGSTLIRVNHQDNRDKLALFDTLTGKQTGVIQLPQTDTAYACWSVPGHNNIVATPVPRQNAKGSKRSFLIDIESKHIITQFDLPVDVIFWEIALKNSKLYICGLRQDYSIDVTTGECQSYDYARHFPPRPFAIPQGYYASWSADSQRAVVTSLFDRNSSAKGQEFHLIDAANKLIQIYEVALTGRTEVHRWLPGATQMIVKRVLDEPPTPFEYWYRRIAGWVQQQTPRMNYQDFAIVDVEKGTVSPWYSWDYLSDVDLAPFPDGKKFLMLGWKRSHFELSTLDAPGTIQWGRGIFASIVALTLTWLILQLVIYPKRIFSHLFRPFRLMIAKKG